MNKRVYIPLIILLFLSLSCTGMAKEDASIPPHLFYEQSSSKWDIRGDAIYLRPDRISEQEITHGTFHTVSFKTFFSWGFKLFGSYYFNDNKQTKIEWMHFRNSNSADQFSVENVDDIKGEGPVDVPYAYNQHFDILNIDLGQRIYLKDAFEMRLLAGIEYANLYTEANYSWTTNTSGSTGNREIAYQLYGLGGFLGLELNFYVTRNLIINLKVNSIVLNRMGNLDYKVSNINRNGGAVQTRDDVHVRTRFNGAILGSDTRIGFTYGNHRLLDDLMLNLGFQTLIFTAPMTKWGGFYIGAKWIGDV